MDNIPPAGYAASTNSEGPGDATSNLGYRHSTAGQTLFTCRAHRMKKDNDNPSMFREGGWRGILLRHPPLAVICARLTGGRLIFKLSVGRDLTTWVAIGIIHSTWMYWWYNPPCYSYMWYHLYNSYMFTYYKNPTRIVTDDCPKYILGIFSLFSNLHVWCSIAISLSYVLQDTCSKSDGIRKIRDLTMCLGTKIWSIPTVDIFCSPFFQGDPKLCVPVTHIIKAPEKLPKGQLTSFSQQISDTMKLTWKMKGRMYSTNILKSSIWTRHVYGL